MQYSLKNSKFTISFKINNMNFKNTVLFVLSISICNLLFAQNIKSITCDCIDYYTNKVDTTKKCIEKEYDRNGNLISEKDNRYYIIIDMKYDSENRIIEKQALYGESFANGTTIYKYQKNEITETDAAMGFLNHKVIRFNSNNDTSEINEIHIDLFGNESWRKTIQFQYNNKNLLRTKTIINEQYKPTLLEEVSTINNELVQVVFSDNNKLGEKLNKIHYSYNANNKLISKKRNLESRKYEKKYQYDINSSLLLSEKQLLNGKTFLEKIYKYNENKKIKEIKITYRDTTKTDNNGALKIKGTENTIFNYDNNGIKSKKIFKEGVLQYVELYKKGLIIKSESMDINNKIYTILYNYKFY